MCEFDIQPADADADDVCDSVDSCPNDAVNDADSDNVCDDTSDPGDDDGQCNLGYCPEDGLVLNGHCYVHFDKNLHIRKVDKICTLLGGSVAAPDMETTSLLSDFFGSNWWYGAIARYGCNWIPLSDDAAHSYGNSYFHYYHWYYDYSVHAYHIDYNRAPYYSDSSYFYDPGQADFESGLDNCDQCRVKFDTSYGQECCAVATADGGVESTYCYGSRDYICELPYVTDFDSDSICNDVDSCERDADNDIDSDALCADTDVCPSSSNNVDDDNDGICATAAATRLTRVPIAVRMPRKAIYTPCHAGLAEDSSANGRTTVAMPTATVCAMTATMCAGTRTLASTSLTPTVTASVIPLTFV